METNLPLHIITNSFCLLEKQIKLDVEPLNGSCVIKTSGISADSCKTCSGMQTISFTDEKGYRRVTPCRGATKLHRIQLFNQATIPARYANATIDSFETKTPQIANYIDQLRSNIKGFKPGQKAQAFVGSPGTGKTHLLASIIRYLTLEKAIPCKYIEFSHMISEIRNLYNENQSDTRILGHLSTVPVLFIDELGKGKCNEFELRIIDELTSKRYNDPTLSTFFASNYLPYNMGGNNYNINNMLNKNYQTFDSLESRVGERVASRIFELCDFVPIIAPDYRHTFQNK